MADQKPFAGLSQEETNQGILLMLAAILDKMPRVTGNDQAAVSIEAGSVGIAASQTLATVTTVATLTNILQALGKPLNGDDMNRAALTTVYDNIKVT